jgi:predicted dehydrogenase
MAAMKKNIAVYVEKPLTWSPWEARQLAIEATKRKLPSQMGNQGHAGPGWRVVAGWIQGGAIGDVKEVHTWTNRPIWPQGMKRPDWTTPIPKGLDWDKWIGPAPMRPFADYKKSHGWTRNACYAPKAWRGWYDFGAGALGDMACHTMDGMFWAMDPGHPTKVTLTKISQHMPESFPSESIVRWDFPATKERPGFVQYWYDGTPKLMNRPKGLEGLTQEEVNKVGSGCVFVGTKGSIRVWGDYGNSPRIVQPKLMRSVGKPDPKLMPEKSPGHQMEFLLAVKGEKPWDFPKSNFAYAGPMTETILLGTVVQKLGKVGLELNYDGKAMKFTNSKEATAMMKRTPRTGW